MTSWSEDDLKRHLERTTRMGSHARPAARGHVRGNAMNKLEARYADVLKARQLAGEVAWWKYECMNLRLGENCFYKTDFLVMLADGLIELHECKGYMEETANVKLRVVAAEYPFPIKLIKWVHGQWEVTEL